ncbi:MAG: SDR family oxidoreductase [Kofleriaceae bacterium]
MADDLANKHFIVTGANTGIGRVTALQLARRGGHVILACRSMAKAREAVDEINREIGVERAEAIQLDLSDLTSVRRCADEILAKNLPIHGLVNNAGVAARRGKQTPQGFEATFGTNHLGHYLFTRLLLDRLKQSAPSRIVNVASEAHYRAKAIDWDALQKPTQTVVGMYEYSMSKLSNVLFTKELARRLEGSGVTTYAVHPGVVASDMWRRIPQPARWLMKKFMISPEEGAQASLVCATAPELASQSGRYYDVGGKERPPNRIADDTVLAAKLWTKSAEWTGLPTG